MKFAVALAAFLALMLPSTAFAQPAADRTITADGVGDATLGLTADELATALGDDYQVGDEVRITVDFDGRVVSSGGEVQFRAAMTDDTEQLTLFIVSNTEYATAEGVGPTTTIAEAEAIYGEATLSWNPDNEGREFVSFENGPDGRIAFRTPGIGGNNVGDYAAGEFETNDYEDGAAIASVWVSCVAGTDCPTPEPTPEPTEEPTATPTPEPTAESTPEPTATATPEPTATPTPDPTPTPDDGDDGDNGTGGDGDDGTSDDDTGDDDGDLPRTGTTEMVLTSIVAVLFVIGGALVLMERRYLCPAWLPVRR